MGSLTATFSTLETSSVSEDVYGTTIGKSQYADVCLGRLKHTWNGMAQMEIFEGST